MTPDPTVGPRDTDEQPLSQAPRRSGAMSRSKGKVGERQVVELAKAAGFEDAHRDWMTPQPNGDIGGVPGTYIEVRRRERVDILAWAREAETAADDKLPIVAFRTSREPWRACVPAGARCRRA